MKKRYLSHWAVTGSLLASACLPVDASISISGVGTHANPSGSNDGLSGICYAGGTQYYAVDDSGGLMQPATISINPSSGAITAASFDSAITLGGTDLEGIDYNPANNSVWVSDETGATIREYSLENADYLSSVAVPPIFASYRANYSLESLTVRGDGLEMWTCNEEALYDTSPVVDDGPLSTDNNGSVVRLQRFTRSSVYGDWVADGQWAYLTESFEADSGFTSAERSGVSDLCLLPDGILLVMERTLGYSSFIPHFENRIYEINFTGATDVSAITSLNGAPYTRVIKTQRWSKDFGTSYNFEGLCLGPRLDDGSLSLMMIADGDDLSKGLYSLKLSGLATRDLTVASAYGTADPGGGPYRYVSGATVTNTVSESRVLQGGTLYECTGWSATGHMPSSGSGTTAVLTLDNDVQLTWNWSQISNPGNTLPYEETFESYPAGFQMPGANGWTATGLSDAKISTNATLISSLATYSEPCEYPVSSADHDQVLEVTGTATNHFNITANQIIWVDYMMLPVHGALPTDMNIPAEAQLVIAFNQDDHPVIWNCDIAAGSGGWAEIDELTVPDDEWVRITLNIDYQTEDPINHVRYFQVYINGTLLTHPQAWTSNDGSGVSGGCWFAMSFEPDQLNIVALKADYTTAGVDDLVVTTDNPLTTPQGVPYEWMAAHNLTNGTYAGEELLDSDNDGVPTWQEWIGDTNPTNQASVLQLTALERDGSGMRVHWDGGVQARQYLERCTDLLTGSWMPVFTNQPPTSVTTSFMDSGATNSAGFYRIKAQR